VYIHNNLGINLFLALRSYQNRVDVGLEAVTDRKNKLNERILHLKDAILHLKQINLFIKDLFTFKAQFFWFELF
jgi:hypothetical protein